MQIFQDFPMILLKSLSYRDKYLDNYNNKS